MRTTGSVGCALAMTALLLLAGCPDNDKSNSSSSTSSSSGGALTPCPETPSAEPAPSGQLPCTLLPPDFKQ